MSSDSPAETEPARSSFTFRFTAGALVRSRVIFQIKAGAQRFGVEYDVLEDKGLLDSRYQIRIAGPAENVDRFHRSLSTWLEEMRR